MQDWHAAVAFKNSGIARTFVAILQQNGIHGKVVEFENDTQELRFRVDISDYERLDQAKSLAEQFSKNPQASEFQKAAWQTGQTYDSIVFPKVELNAQTFMSVPFTSVILLLCTSVYIGYFFGLFPFFDQWLSIQPLVQLSENHQWWRLFGPNFLHFGILHIAFNLLWWWILGANLERTFGTFSLIVLFIVSSLFANLSQLLITGPNFGGLSGVIYALFGFVWWIGWLRPSWGLSLPKAYIGFILVWLLLGYAQVLPVNMANEAHLFGLISGCLLALLLHMWVKMVAKQD